MEPINQALDELLTKSITFIPRLITALVVFVVFLLFAALLKRALRRAMEKRSTSKELTVLLPKLALWAIIALGIVVSLQQVDFDVTAFLAGLGVIGFTIGFAVQDVSKNFIAGLLLLLQQPFAIDDAIQVGDFSGTVKSINLRATELRTVDGKTVLIPNADVFTSPIINYGRAGQRRIELAVGVAYDSDLEKVKQVTIEALKSIPGMGEAASAPQVIFNQFDNASINCMVYYWIDITKISILDARDQGVRLLKRAYEREGIELPYPTQVIHLRQ